MVKKGDLGFLLVARWNALNISEIAELLGFSWTPIPTVYKGWSEKKKIFSGSQLSGQNPPC